MNGFFEAIDNSQGITLSGRFLPRARLGLHLQLSRLHQEFEQAAGASETAWIIRQYLGLCGLDDLSGVESLYVFTVLIGLNSWQWQLPFMVQEEGRELKPPAPYEYPGRIWAWYLHKIASRYGWTKEQVFNLWPEEAACYLQEIFISDFDEYEDIYTLSDRAWHYDQNSKTSKYHPIPKPSWMAPRIEPKTIRIHRSFLPAGLVIRGDGTEVTYH